MASEWLQLEIFISSDVFGHASLASLQTPNYYLPIMFNAEYWRARRYGNNIFLYSPIYCKQNRVLPYHLLGILLLDVFIDLAVLY